MGDFRVRNYMRLSYYLYSYIFAYNESHAVNINMAC